jgi:hypothetical protein
LQTLPGVISDAISTGAASKGISVIVIDKGRVY